MRKELKINKFKWLLKFLNKGNRYLFVLYNLTRHTLSMLLLPGILRLELVCIHGNVDSIKIKRCFSYLHHIFRAKVLKRCDY